MKNKLIFLFQIIMLSSLFCVSQPESNVVQGHGADDWEEMFNIRFSTRVRLLVEDIKHSLDSLQFASSYHGLGDWIGSAILAHIVGDLEDSAQADLNREQQILYIYNILRKLLHLTSITAVSEIDTVWLTQVAKEATAAAVKEKYQYDFASASQVQSVRQAEAFLKLKDTIVVFSHRRNGGMAREIEQGFYSLALPHNPDVSAQLFSIYHELGHIVYRDFDYFNAPLADRLENQSQDGSFNESVKRINRYLELGTNTLDNSTPVGKHVRRIMADSTPLWIPPANEGDYQNMRYLRDTEKRADLFALEKLFEQQQFSSILHTIARRSFGETPRPITAGPLDDHPSELERALYMTGFLVDHGIDVNAAFRQWYANATCKAVPQELGDMLFTMTPGSKGACDFMKIYRQVVLNQETHLSI